MTIDRYRLKIYLDFRHPLKPENREYMSENDNGRTNLSGKRKPLGLKVVTAAPFRIFAKRVTETSQLNGILAGSSFPASNRRIKRK
jgi:hypothetical protein